MKKLSLFFLTILMCVSCTKIDVIHEIYNPRESNEILFSNHIGSAGTKAIIEGNIYDESFTFYVLGTGGYYTSGGAGTVTRMEDSVKYNSPYRAWRTINRTYFWKFAEGVNTSDPMDFFAIHPAGVDLSGNDSNVPFTSYTPGANISGTNDQIVTMTGVTPGIVVGSQMDLMTSTADNIVATRTNTGHINYVDIDNTTHDPAHGNESSLHGTATDNTVNFRFHHEFAQIKFQARTSAKNHITITVKKLEFIVPCIKANASTYGLPTNETYKTTWTLSNAVSDVNHNYTIIDYAGDDNNIKYSVDLVNTQNSTNPSWYDLSYHYNSGTDNHNILVIPQDLSGLADGTMVRITYDVTNSMDLSEDCNFTNVVKEIALSKIIEGDNPDEWKAGYIYTYRFDVNLYEIIFSATVEDWMDINSQGYVFY